MADVTIDIDEIIAEWGAFYINHGQNMSNLKSRIYKPSETESFFALKLTDDTQVRNSLVSMDEVLQAYQDAFTPKGNVAFLPATINLYPQKIDWQKNPGAFFASWAGFLAGDQIDRAQWPLIRYIIEQHILPRRDEDKETTSFTAEFVVPTPGTAGDAIDRTVGIRKLIRDWNDAGRTNALTTGALETDPVEFCTQVEDYVMQMPPEIRAKMDFIFMNMDKETLYKQGKREKYNKYYAQETDLVQITDVPNISVKGLQSMGTSEMLWNSFAANRSRYQKRSKNQNIFKIESVKREVALYNDFHEGVAFEIPEFIYHNDRDLT